MSSDAASVDDKAKPFKERHSFEDRVAMARKMRKKHDDRYIPVICEKSSASTLTAADKVKYLIPKDCTVAVFLSSIRKKLTISQEESLFLFFNNTIPTAMTTFEQLYAMHADLDGFLYATYQEESVYGN